MHIGSGAMFSILKILSQAALFFAIGETTAREKSCKLPAGRGRAPGRHRGRRGAAGPGAAAEPGRRAAPEAALQRRPAPGFEAFCADTAREVRAYLAGPPGDSLRQLGLPADWWASREVAGE